MDDECLEIEGAGVRFLCCRGWWRVYLVGEVL